MQIEVPSGSHALVGHFYRPDLHGESTAPLAIVAHGFPSAPGGGANSYDSFPGLAERLAAEYGWFGMSFQFRGVGESEGSFSIDGWIEDIAAAVTYARSIDGVGQVWLIGFGTGGALSINAAALDSSIAGVASIGAPADFADWAADPAALETFGRDIGVITSADPVDVGHWGLRLAAASAELSAAKIAERPLLVMHGTNDEVVNAIDARAIAEAHGRADLRIMPSAGHHLRHDPRAMAVLFGWLERQRYRASAAEAPGAATVTP